MKLLLSLFTILIMSTSTFAQAPDSKDHYFQIPDPPAAYTATNVIARMVDGLGFRYYWATADLRPEDLVYKPSEDGRTAQETIDHVLGMSMWVRGTLDPSYQYPEGVESLSYAEKRALTLENYKQCSLTLRAMNDEALAKIKIPLGVGTELPYWNHINGPISDSIWHVGQIVSFRRASGNPFNGKASVLMGKLKE